MPRKPSQADRLLNLLRDGKAHSTPEIQVAVYGGDHLGTARIASRIHDLRARGHEVESWRDPDNETVWWYQLKGAAKPKPVERKVEYVNIGGTMHARYVDA